MPPVLLALFVFAALLVSGGALAKLHAWRRHRRPLPSPSAGGAAR